MLRRIGIVGGILAALFILPTCKAQVIELACPPATTSVQSLQTTDNLTGGKIRQNYCVDNSGNVFQNVSGSVTSGNINGILSVDGVKFTTIASAVSAAGSVNKTLIIIPSTYTGTECPALQANLTFWDLRGGGLAGSPCVNNVQTYNGDDGSVNSTFRSIRTQNSPTDSNTNIYAQCFYGGTTMPANQTLECLTGETDIVGNYASIPASTSLSGSEHNLIFTSTGAGTVNNAYAAIFGIKTLSGSTTPISNAYSFRAIAFSKGGTGTITNAIGALFDNQTVGSTNNWAFESQGESRFDCSTAAQQCIHINANTSANRNTLRITNTAGSGGDWLLGDGSCSAGTVGQFEMCNLNVGANSFMAIKNTGTSFALLSFGPSAGRTYTFPDNSGVMTQTIASGTAVMTTAAIAAGACGATVTVAAANVVTTDTIEVAFNAAPAGTNAGLTQWPTAGNVNFAYCPGVAETPAAATINWKVVR